MGGKALSQTVPHVTVRCGGGEGTGWTETYTWIPGIPNTSGQVLCR